MHLYQSYTCLYSCTCITIVCLQWKVKYMQILQQMNLILFLTSSIKTMNSSLYAFYTLLPNLFCTYASLQCTCTCTSQPIWNFIVTRLDVFMIQKVQMQMVKKHIHVHVTSLLITLSQFFCVNGTIKCRCTCTFHYTVHVNQCNLTE